MAETSKDLNIRSACEMPSGYQIPILGYGVSYSMNEIRKGKKPVGVEMYLVTFVYQTPASEAKNVVLHAFRSGYRHVDSAHAYRNERPCAEAIRASGLKREEIFFTSKVPPRAMGYNATKKAIDESFAETSLDYIDLYLIHCPYGGRDARTGSWRALVEAQRAGKIRSIGVSNYGLDHLEELEAYIQELDSASPGSGGVVSVHQIELHPWCDRTDVVHWCKRRNIIVQAYSPLVRAQRNEEPMLKKLAGKYGKTCSQILIRWSIQMGFVPLPKSVTPSRIEENADVFGWTLEEGDVKKLNTGEYKPVCWDPTTSGIDN